MMIPFSRPANWLYHEGTCHECGHTWHPSCLYCISEMLARVSWSGLKVYLPLYLLSDVIRRRPLKAVLLQTLPLILRSSLFLGINGSGFVVFICIIRRLIGRFYFFSAAFLPAFFASLVAILIERKNRRGLLTGYVGTLAVEAIYCMLKYRGLVKPLPYGEVLLFSFASSVLLHAFRSKEGLHDAIGGLLKVLFHPWMPSGLTKLTQALRARPPSLGNSCKVALLNIILVSVWSFAIGYLFQALFGVVSLGTKALKQPERLKKALLRVYNAKFAAFLAALAGGFKLLNAILLALPISRDLRLSLAGLFAGLSMFSLRSSAISLYVAWKALEVLYFRAVKRGWAKKFYYGDVMLYALCTATLFHAVFFEGHNIRLGYWMFLDRITKGKLQQLNYSALDTFGTHASIRCREVQEQLREREGRREE